MQACFFDTFCPCPLAASIRLLAAIAHGLGLNLRRFGAEQVFVQSGLSEDVYMRLPKGCGAMSGKVVMLCRSQYGLRQASRQ